MNVIREDIIIYQGTQYSGVFNALDDNSNPINISGISISAKIKNSYGDTGYLGTFSVVTGALNSGEFSLTLNSSGSSGLPITQGIYNVEGSLNGEVIKYFWGYVDVIPEIITD